jgi:hydrogenase nickel incorporation protein HypA/HybF
MHEMSLAESVREIVEETARANDALRVKSVRLEIGVLSLVEADAMRFAFDVVMRHSLAEGARLDIVETPGTAWCMRCSETVTIERRGDACPRCESHQLQVSGGDRLRVMDIEIE